jgi:hypothetical protein
VRKETQKQIDFVKVKQNGKNGGSKKDENSDPKRDKKNATKMQLNMIERLRKNRNDGSTIMPKTYQEADKVIRDLQQKPDKDKRGEF